MSESNRVLIWMLAFLAVIVALSAFLLHPLQTAFFANQVFNGMILGVLALGIVINFRHVLALKPEMHWLGSFRRGDSAVRPKRGPRLLAPMAKMLAGRDRTRFRLSAITMRSLLDGIRLRLDEHRDFSRYMIGLLIFLGLLGTFWGLLETVTSVGQVIAGLSSEGSDPNQTFADLKRDLQGPLSGMGTAFSSSLFGLGGALILGFLDLQAGHAQNHFYNQVEEWLSGLTHLSGTALNIESETPLPHYVEALLEQTADSLHNLQRVLMRSEDERRSSQHQLFELSEKVAELTDQMRVEEKIIINLAKTQAHLQPAIARLADGITDRSAKEDEMRNHLRNVDVCLTRLLEEFAGARGQMMEELRGEMRLLIRTLAQQPKLRA